MMNKCRGFSIFAWIVIFAVLLQESSLLLACGVGKGSYANKEYPPFSKYQQKPERDEESAIASGPFNHKLRFGSRQFKKDIIRHMGTNIVFRDDEGNGADRYMTRRCERALKRLAQYVRIKWNNRVKVRVIEAWDEDGEHSPHSLHYEGRAIDITTSDRDRRKYGTLASLAYYKAEFDWVTFLDGHVHVSCKRDDAVDERNSCFPATGTVITEDGSSTTIDQLKIGDKVLAQSESGTLMYSRVIMFMDHKPNAVINNYVIIETENPRRRIELTKRHLIFASKENTTFQTIFAEKIKPGDHVKVLSPTNNSELITAKVTKVSLQRRRGAFAPLTEEGTILVNGVLASCYALTENQNTAHMSFLPWRKAFDVTKHFTSTNIQTGLHWYVRILRTINRYVGALPEIYAQ